MIRNNRGQILPVVVLSLVVLTIFIFGLVQWIQNNSKWSANEQKTTSAINLAEAGVDRGTWKLQSSTSTWATAYAGTVISGYNFDTTYTDVPGGTYRIKFTNPGNQNITIVAEGRDYAKTDTRAVSAVFKNQTIYSGLMSGGNVTWSKGLGLFWGPIIAQGNITLQNGVDAWYFPLKYAKGDVIGTAANPRNTSWPLPPNTDNVEWWSNYAGVPNVPILDFATLRSSAALTGTLNVYGCQGTGAAWDQNGTCNPAGAPHNLHFGDSANYIKTVLGDAAHTKSYVWYWDGDVVLTGQFNASNQPYNPGRSTELLGTIVVRGNLTIASPGDFVYTGHVPANAWQQENKLTAGTFDTAASNEYPADTGLHSSAPTFCFGYSCPTQFHVPLAICGGSPCNEYATVGMRGLVYVGGNLTIISYMDINGALWVNGNVIASGGSYSQFCSIFYDDTLVVPTLNVILVRQSWQETSPSNTAWQ